jgi:hypothetical protein
MKSEFFLDLCFIRERGPYDSFIASVQSLLTGLFAGKADWSAEEKQEEGTEIVISEVKGADVWEKEEDIVSFLEEHAPSQFWEWLQGYRVKVDVKERAKCHHCGKKANAAVAT